MQLYLAISLFFRVRVGCHLSCRDGSGQYCRDPLQAWPSLVRLRPLIAGCSILLYFSFSELPSITALQSDLHLQQICLLIQKVSISANTEALDVFIQKKLCYISKQNLKYLLMSSGLSFTFIIIQILRLELNKCRLGKLAIRSQS